jgi:hypothetical protein
MAITSLNSVNQLIIVMVKCGVLFEVRTEFLNIIYTGFGFKWLIGPEKSCSADTDLEQEGIIRTFPNLVLHPETLRYRSECLQNVLTNCMTALRKTRLVLLSCRLERDSSKH